MSVDNVNGNDNLNVNLNFNCQLKQLWTMHYLPPSLHVFKKNYYICMINKKEKKKNWKTYQKYNINS